MKSCFFIGHRDAPDSVLAHLTVTLERLIVEESVGFFYVGQYGSFDRLATLAVKQLKQHYPFITLMLVLPYHPADRPIPTPPGFDGTYYPEGMENVPKRYAIVKANKQMVSSGVFAVLFSYIPPARFSMWINPFFSRRWAYSKRFLALLAG